MIWVSIALLIAAVVGFIVFYIGRGNAMARTARGIDQTKQVKIYSTICVVASVLAVAGLVLFLIAGSYW